MSMFVLHAFHLFAVVPFFLYVALTRSSMPTAVFYSLIALGIVLVVYHGYKAVVRYMGGSNYWWVNLIHALIVGPLLIYIGVKQKEAPRAAYEGLFLLTFAALGYHLKELAEDVGGSSKS
uniref:Uncharacterized protein n=1 Tax=viral metagenome TaxID=1070528 RepID=A0A6C0IBL2_9ZZZZ